MPSLLRRAVELYGDDDYVVVPDDRISFRQAEEQSRVLATRLLAWGAGKGTRIGIFLPTGIDWVLTWLAAARIGSLAMLFPATYRPSELRRAMIIGDVDLLVAPSGMFGRDYEAFLEEAVPTLAQQIGRRVWDPIVPFLRSIWLTGGTSRAWAETVDGGSSFDDGVEGPMLAAVEDQVSPADPLLVIYTSGSSADPKAVVHTQGGAIRKIQPALGMCLPASHPGRTFCAMPFFWVGGPQELLGALHSGAAVVTQPRFDATEALDLLERERCTSILGWANILDRLSTDPTYADRDLSNLNIPPRPTSSRGDPRNLGMTETFGPHGNRDWFDYKVIDPDTGQELSDGEEGEFLVRGFGLMAAMYKKEREEVFDRDGWYHTGDRGYIEDGAIYFTGRYSETIKAGGANVSPLEVERVLESLPGVSLALVIGVPDPEKGEIVAAAVVPSEGTTLTPDALRAEVNRQLSAYKVPTRWQILPSDQLPWLPSGKADKRTLKSMF